MSETTRNAFIGHILLDHECKQGRIIEAMDKGIRPESLGAYADWYDLLCDLYNSGKKLKQPDIVARAGATGMLVADNIPQAIKEMREAASLTIWGNVLHEAQAGQVRLNMTNLATDLAKASRTTDLSGAIEELSARFLNEITFTPHVEDLSNEVVIDRVKADLKKAHESDASDGVRFPIRVLNEAYAGLPGGLHIWAARPKQGKTSALLWASMFMASEEPIGIIPLEMNHRKMVLRQLSSMIGQGTRDVSMGRAIQSSFDRAMDGLDRMKRSTFTGRPR